VHSTKKKFSAIMASNCGSKSLREEFVKDLGQYIPVDVYGKCGSLTCPKKVDCREYIAKDYKFYLAFENS
jgi:alpha-1,3-fucosyltransferase